MKEDSSGVPAAPSSPTARPRNCDGFFSAVKNKFHYWSTQYELALCISLFEPWEKMVINSLVGGSVFMMTYSTIVYLPDYLANLMDKIVNLRT